MSSTRQPAAVLLVDDDEGIRRFVRHILTEEGFRVIEACDGADALEVECASLEPIDLLLTDMIMPKINGWVLAERLMQKRPGVAVLFMSGYVENSIHLAQDSHANMLQKPFTTAALLAAVRQVLASTEP
jgi:two-component system, cell cycle sensor histidine kinase and response regulator CckA